MRKNAIITTVLTTFLFVCTGYAANQDYKKSLESSSSKVRVDTLKRIERSVVNDEQLFQMINSKLQNEITGDLATSKDRDYLDEMAWTCKALASSGDNQYLTTIKKAAETAGNKRLRNHCNKSVDDFTRYVDRRGAKEKPAIDGFSQEMSGYIHMLQSDDYRTKREGVKRIMKSSEANEKVYDIVRDGLLAEVTKLNGKGSRDAIDALSYYCLCLSASGLNKYQGDLEKVVSMSNDRKLTKYAKQALNEL